MAPGTIRGCIQSRNFLIQFGIIVASGRIPTGFGVFPVGQAVRSPGGPVHRWPDIPLIHNGTMTWLTCTAPPATNFSPVVSPHALAAE